MSTLFDTEVTTGPKQNPQCLPWKKMTARELAISQGAKLIEGRDWVDDEVRYRDEREFAAKWSNEQVTGGVRPGPGLQIRPGKYDDGRPCIRLCCGKRFSQVEKCEAENRMRTVDFVHIVIGAIVSFGGRGTHVYVAGLIDMGRSHITTTDILGNADSTVGEEHIERLGVWKKDIITRQERQFTRCYVPLCRRDWATSNRDEIVKSEMIGTIIKLIPKESQDGLVWLDTECQYLVQEEYKNSYLEVADAVYRKVNRNIVGKKNFFGRVTIAVRHAIERRSMDALKFLKMTFRPMPAILLESAINAKAPYKGKNSTRYYDSIVKELFVLRRPFAESEKYTKILAATGWNPSMRSIPSAPTPTDCEIKTAANTVVQYAE